MNRLLVLLLLSFTFFAAACSNGDDTPERLSATASDADTDADAADSEAAATDSGVDELNVAYFEEWPTPNQFGQADGSLAEAAGVSTINWKPYGSGGEMTDAMIAGEVDISYGQGLTPFANAVNDGADLRMIGVAVAYAEADNCIVQNSLGVTRANAAEVLAGKTVMTSFGNVSHYKMLELMRFLGVDIDGLDIVEAESGANTAAAFKAGEIDVGCAFGASIEDKVANDGAPILTGAEMETEVGVFTYDIVSIPTSFGREHPEAVTNFLAATEEFNLAWAADPASRNPTIATAASMDDVGNFLGGELWFSFPSIEEQLSKEWMGGTVADAMKSQLETFVELG